MESLVAVPVRVTAPRVKVTMLFAAYPVPVTTIVEPGATENSGFALMWDTNLNAFLPVVVPSLALTVYVPAGMAGTPNVV